MKKSASVLLFAGVSLLAVSCKNQKESMKDEGIFLSDMDTTIKPGDNFFNYAGGGWIKANPIPEDQIGWGTFYRLAEDNRLHLKEIAEDAAAKRNTTKGSPEQ